MTQLFYLRYLIHASGNARSMNGYFPYSFFVLVILSSDLRFFLSFDF